MKSLVGVGEVSRAISLILEMTIGRVESNRIESGEKISCRSDALAVMPDGGGAELNVERMG